MMTLALPIAVFIFVAAVVIVFGYRRYVLVGRTYENLSGSIARDDRYVPGEPGQETPPFFSVVRVAEALGNKVPPSASAASVLQGKLMAAGYRSRSALPVLFGLKLIVLMVISLTMLVIEIKSDGSPAMRIAGILIGIVAGYRLPDYFLARQITRRSKKLRKALPDALDLIIVCAEAGLTIDRAFRTVGTQLAFLHPDLSQEFGLFNAEVSAGLRRKEALENLALRTREPELRKFVAVLAQADRFGTSMGDALRTHAEYLRVRRRHEAEEKASKVGVKLIFPIFFFIMPCMLLVTVGPAVIVIIKQLLPAMQGISQ